MNPRIPLLVGLIAALVYRCAGPNMTVGKGWQPNNVPHNPLRSRTGHIAWSAVIVAFGVLAGSGVGYRVFAHYLARSPDQVRFAPGTLAGLPLEIGGWVGRDEDIAEAIVRVADVDDYVRRSYVRKSDLRTVGLWIAFGVRARDLMPHRPEVCYPGAGWTLQRRETAGIALDNGEQLSVHILEFSPGGLGPERLTVLNYYLVDDQSCEDVSLLRSKAWRGQASVRYVAQVQITCEATPVAATVSPDATVQAFAAELHPLLRVLLHDVTQPAGEGG